MMTIIPIQSDNLATYLNDLISLNDEFLSLTEGPEERSIAEKEAILMAMVREPSTHLLVILNEGDEAIGMSYYNYGAGYACGGRYLWVNGIYVREPYQGKGYGSSLLKHIAESGRAEGARLLMGCRDRRNRQSQTLFQKIGFVQEEQTIMFLKT